MILKYQRCNLESKECIKFFVDVLLHHKTKKLWNRAMNILKMCNILNRKPVLSLEYTKVLSVDEA